MRLLEVDDRAVMRVSTDGGETFLSKRERVVRSIMDDLVRLLASESATALIHMCSHHSGNGQHDRGAQL